MSKNLTGRSRRGDNWKRHVPDSSEKRALETLPVKLFRYLISSNNSRPSINRLSRTGNI